MQLLISKSDIQKYRQLSNTSYDDKLNEMILDAQIIDVRPLLGEKLYNKIIADADSYTELLEGGTYQYQGNTYNNYGLKMVLSYYAYARYTMFGSSIDTSFALVEKLNDTSKPTDYAQKKALWHNSNQAAFSIWENVREYLIRTKNTDFTGNCQTKNNGGFNFSRIG